MADDTGIIQDDDAIFEEPQPDKPDGGSPENEPDKPEKDQKPDKPQRSEVIQKAKWRDRALKAEGALGKVETLQAELEQLRSLVKKPENDQEAKAQEYIREQARNVFKELQETKQKEEAKTTREFEDKVAAVIEENPDVSEEELLEVIEDLELEPEVALKVLRRQTPKKDKPKMPTAKRGSSESPSAEKRDDSKKTMWQILQEEVKAVRDK